MVGGLAPDAGQTSSSVLTVSDVMELPLRNCHLCVLSACETGLQSVEDEDRWPRRRSPRRGRAAPHDFTLRKKQA